MTAGALRFQLGARTIATVRRSVIRVALSLDEALAMRAPVLPPLGSEDGLLVTSLPAALPRPTIAGTVASVRQRYARYWIDLTLDEAEWLAALSGQTRSTLKRKAKRLAAEGDVSIERFDDADGIARFHPLARAVSATTYQERLLDAGLPVDPAALLRLAAAGRVRAWLLSIDGRAIAYLCCTAQGETLRYDHVGHDPAAAPLSPGTVLIAQAIRDLIAERRFARFDFTEGEGQHKRTLATGAIECIDLLILRATWRNRAALAALRAFDAAAARAKRAARHPALAATVRRVRR